MASQFHPEFKSRPERPAPLFRGFVAAALEHSGEHEDASSASGEDGGQALQDAPSARSTNA